MGRNRTYLRCKRPRRAYGQYVYKYGRIENADHLSWLEGLILRHTVYFPKPAELNDPREARPKFAAASLTDYKMLLLRGYLGTHPGPTQEEQAQVLKVISTNVNVHGLAAVMKAGEATLAALLADQRIYSLARRRNNRHLWEQYAANHRGYCLEFLRSHLFSAAMQVRYRSYAVFDPTEAQVNSAFFFYKRNKWMVEEELRVVHPRRPEGHLQFPPNVLVRIFLGREIPAETRRIIRDWSAQREPRLIVADEPRDLV